ncbi:hypothetical protein LG296_19735 (plasmid) [Ureibacillus chungkukjangi]|uniref:Rad52/Rad22 family DNA repair protein n=1 Tax=Ureibacillus chungkukjangi TaxID=1202712 RepID=UPI000D35534E|nr:Rad52/Rad22 family DNA repair protein [Ureibacillus chungkukjangi]MCM3390537.1 Rad52/Rad22 family DNA repair protein [Ureibacillus chungkukjangi]
MTNLENGFNVLSALAEPMGDNEIEWKVQTVTSSPNGLKALVVPYVQVRAIQSRLDEVCGLNWKSEFKILPMGSAHAIECTISIFHENKWISRSDAAEPTNIESIKGGYSDSMKRAAVQYGIGRFLYSLPPQWVPIQNNRPNQSHEYINSKYKVNGRPEFVKGYYIRPSLKQILNQQNSTKPTNQQPRSQQHPRSNQPTQPRGNQQTQSSQPRGNQQPSGNTNAPTTNELQDAKRNIIDCLQFLNIPIGFLPKLCELVSIPHGYKSLDQATYPELQRLFAMLNPVKMYMLLGKEQFKLNEQQLFSYASDLLKEPIGKPSNLFNKLDSVGVNLIFDRIRSERKQQLA